MSISLEQLSAQMRRGEQVPLRHTMQVVLTLSIPSILQQIVVTAVEYIDAAMVGHIGASATASIGIVSSSTWLMHGMLAGLYMSFAIQVAQYLGADRQADARGVLRQSMIFNLAVGLAAAAFGIGISRFLPGWLGADPSLRADASAYFAIWSASLPFLMVMGTYSSIVRSQHRCQRCHAGRRRQCRLLCAEPRQHVGHPAHPCHPAGPALWAGGRVVCHEL